MYTWGGGSVRNGFPTRITKTNPREKATETEENREKQDDHFVFDFPAQAFRVWIYSRRNMNHPGLQKMPDSSNNSLSDVI
ncbi:hypothetical protein LXL04_025812 [Taraxacum kok-saghyz]